MHRYVFDAYGTLFDLQAAAERHQAAIGPQWQQLSSAWRTKHIEYSWHHSLTRTPATFWRLAQRSLDFAIAATGCRSAAKFAPVYWQPTAPCRPIRRCGRY